MTWHGQGMAAFVMAWHDMAQHDMTWSAHDMAWGMTCRGPLHAPLVVRFYQASMVPTACRHTAAKRCAMLMMPSQQLPRRHQA